MSCYAEGDNIDFDVKYKQKAQLLVRVNKLRNHYIVRPGCIIRWENATSAQRELMKNFENEIHYKDEGEQSLEPSIMVEPMYAVARSMLHRNIKQDCIIKENDVIKFGRARFKVSEVSILERDKDIREQK